MLCRIVSKNIPKPAFLFSQTRSYHPLIVEHFENPRNAGKIEEHERRPDERIVTGLVGSPSCGDVLRLQLKVDENGYIRDARFKTFGCGSAIASSSFSTELVKNKKIQDAEKIRNLDIAKHLSLPPVKNHCSMLAEDAIKEAIRNFKKQQDSQIPTRAAAR